MADKYTKAVAVTAHDSNDLTLVADALYVGAGDYTDSQNLATLAGDAGEPNYLVNADDSFTFISRGSTTTYLNNNGSSAPLVHPNNTDAVFTAVLNSIPEVRTTDATLNYKSMVFFNGGNYLSITDNVMMDWGTGDFSALILIKFNNTAAGNKEMILARDHDDSVWSLYKDTDNVIKVAHAGSEPTSGVTVVTDRWYTIEWSRSSGTETIYIDGVNQGSAASNSENYDAIATNNMIIGSSNDAGQGRFLSGSVPWFAFWKGSALSAADRTAYNNYLNDRYLKTPQVDVAYISSEDTSSVTSKRLKRGTVHPLAVKRVMDTGTDGSSIVALYK